MPAESRTFVDDPAGEISVTRLSRARTAGFGWRPANLRPAPAAIATGSGPGSTSTPPSPRTGARPADALKGLIELRGIGILRRDYEACAVVGLVVDLAADDAERLPERGEVAIAGMKIPRLAVAPGMAALPAVLAMVTSCGDIGVLEASYCGQEPRIGD